MSHRLNGAECNYSATDQEFVAIVMVLKCGGTIYSVNHLYIELIMLVQSVADLTNI